VPAWKSCSRTQQIDAPNIIADANNFSLVETQHGADTTIASYCSCWLKPLDMSEPELSMGWVDSWVGLGWVFRNLNGLGWVGWGHWPELPK
jgi:hypothetical protein